MAEPYRFQDLPLNPIQTGTTVLVAGPSHAGTRLLGLRLVAGSRDGGAIIVTTNRRAVRIAQECDRAGITVADDDTALIDCVGDDDPGVPARILPVSGPSDLTGIGMRYSDTYREFSRAGIDRVRTGICSVSTLLMFTDLRTVSRFVHSLVGRIDGVDGLGVLLVDPSTHDDCVVSTLDQFSTGRIDVRKGDDGPELRARGLPDQSNGWASFHPRG